MNQFNKKLLLSFVALVLLALVFIAGAMAAELDEFTGNWFLNGDQNSYRIGIFDDGFWYLRSPLDDGFGRVTEGSAVPDHKNLVLYAVLGDEPEDTVNVGSLSIDGHLNLTDDGTWLLDGETSYSFTRMSPPDGEVPYSEFKQFVGKWVIGGKPEMESITIHRAGIWEIRNPTAEGELGMITSMGTIDIEGKALTLYEIEGGKVGSLTLDKRGRMNLTLTENYNFLLSDYDHRNLKFYPERKSR